MPIFLMATLIGLTMKRFITPAQRQIRVGQGS
jgi:hypothetical protein